MSEDNVQIITLKKRRIAIFERDDADLPLRDASITMGSGHGDASRPERRSRR